MAGENQLAIQKLGQGFALRTTKKKFGGQNGTQTQDHRIENLTH